jgi:hypothetical protein
VAYAAYLASELNRHKLANEFLAEKLGAEIIELKAVVADLSERLSKVEDVGVKY